jgi:hypothetical protein
MTNFDFTLPTEIPRFPVGREDGGEGETAVATAPAVLEALDSEIYRDMRWCANCGGERIFVEVYEFEAGRVGVCLGCGDERVVRFSREVA